jgi:hypothetical protein
MNGVRLKSHHLGMTELISCHDCGNGVSFTALACPHCGSTEPSGPYIRSRKEARRYRIEERNDRILITIM